jgi:hypothetical protein
MDQKNAEKTHRTQAQTVYGDQPPKQGNQAPGDPWRGGQPAVRDGKAPNKGSQAPVKRTSNPPNTSRIPTVGNLQKVKAKTPNVDVMSHAAKMYPSASRKRAGK